MLIKYKLKITFYRIFFSLNNNNKKRSSKCPYNLRIVLRQSQKENCNWIIADTCFPSDPSLTNIRHFLFLINDTGLILLLLFLIYKCYTRCRKSSRNNTWVMGTQK